jgi:hypothetical protein
MPFLKYIIDISHNDQYQEADDHELSEQITPECAWVAVHFEHIMDPPCDGPVVPPTEFVFRGSVIMSTAT